MARADRRLIWMAVAVALIAGRRPVGAARPARAMYDLAADFSVDRNPSGPWQYGFSVGPSTAPEQFRLSRVSAVREGIGFWHPAAADNGGGDYYPYVAGSPAKQPRSDATGSWAIGPDELALEGSNVGQYAAVRFVAPRAGRYRVKVRFAGVHFRLSTTDVHVQAGATPLFDAVVDGYGGDPAFHPIEGAAPRAVWSGDVVLQARDAVTFAVGYGPNHTHFNDTTAVRARVRWLGAGS